MVALVKKVFFGIALSKLLLAGLVLLSLALSYIPDRAYHIPGPDIASQNFHVIEFNDAGEPHDPDQWLGLKARIEQSERKPELLIFIHGWHHSAAPDDENFVAFQQFYQQMAARDNQRNLIGLYIGWRGDKFDPLWLDGSTDATSQVEILDFPTIFQRKSVARRIGRTGFSQLLDNLDQLESSGKLQRYTVVGHSLGGALALHGSKERIMQAIARGEDNPNLFVLLNPAVRASEYKPMDTLLSVDRQKPAMVVLQSKGDYALKEAWQWLRYGERVMGNSWALTHDMDRCPRGDCSIPLNMPKALREHDAKPGCMMMLAKSGWKARARPQARHGVNSCQDANQQAVWVLAVSDDIISGHNGILTEDHAKALSEVMAMIDLHRNQLPVAQRQQLTAPAEQTETAAAQLAAAGDAATEPTAEAEATSEMAAVPAADSGAAQEPGPAAGSALPSDTATAPAKPVSAAESPPHSLY